MAKSSNPEAADSNAEEDNFPLLQRPHPRGDRLPDHGEVHPAPGGVQHLRPAPRPLRVRGRDWGGGGPRLRREEQGTVVHQRGGGVHPVAQLQRLWRPPALPVGLRL